MNFYEKIQKLSKDSGVSFNQIEKDLNLGKNSLYNYKKQQPTSQKIIELASYFSVSTDYLINDDIADNTPGMYDLQNYEPLGKLVDSLIDYYKKYEKRYGEDKAQTLLLIINNINSFIDASLTNQLSTTEKGDEISYLKDRMIENMNIIQEDVINNIDKLAEQAK